MITQLRLVNYKGFEKFTLTLRAGTSVLVGPNNAGKSTIIHALRLCSALLAIAKRKNPDLGRIDIGRDRNVRGYSITGAANALVDENIRYEGRELEARLELKFKNKATLYVVWPVESEPYFYLEHIPGVQPPSLRVVREFYSTLGIVQTMAPLEPRESLLSESHVRDNIGGPLASRHFRNQLYYRRQAGGSDYLDYLSYLSGSTPEIKGLTLLPSAEAPIELDLFYLEAGSRAEKEISWAGDGLQIWIQLLFHVWRLRDSETLVLDEPDVFLHPDLQRRLIHILACCLTLLALVFGHGEVAFDGLADLVAGRWVAVG
jgi:hypothetical protein